ncbi:MAG: L,D-transpeptidase family protein [Nitrospirota bacterium]
MADYSVIIVSLKLKTLRIIALLILSFLLGTVDPVFSSDTGSSGYSALREYLLKYRDIAKRGGWPAVTKGPSLRKGDRSERVTALRRRLTATEDISSRAAADEFLFDEELHNAVIRFQKRHGLIIDGVAGKETVRMLNVPVEKRIFQMEINLERFRDIKDLGDRYICINIADFELKVIEHGNSVMNMKVIVGKQYWNSPLFSSQLTHVVFNPSWYVPTSIAIEEILPKIKEKPDYLSKESIKVFSKEKNRLKEINTASINWADVTAENFRYKLVQVPGIKNPLGKLKFLFPNEYFVYLHDTPAKVLFEKSSRAFSHGCIRIEKPVELAEYLFRDDPSWTPERISAMIERGKEVKVPLPAPVTIHILYLTTWVDEENVLQFRDDIYSRDIRGGKL